MSNSLQAEAERPSSVRHSAPAPPLPRLPPIATAVHAIPGRQAAATGCGQDTVSIPLEPVVHATNHSHRQGGAATPSHACTDSDPFLDEDTRSASLSCSDGPSPCGCCRSHSRAATPPGWRRNAAYAVRGACSSFDGPEATSPAWDAVPWADDTPPSDAAAPLRHVAHCRCRRCRANPVDLSDELRRAAYAFASVGSSGTASSESSNPQQAFLGSREIYGTLSRALAELGAQSSGPLDVLEDSDQGLACGAGGSGVFGTSFLGQFDTCLNGEVPGGCLDAVRNPLQPRDVAPWRCGHGSDGAVSASAADVVKVQGEAYLGTCRLPETAASRRAHGEIVPVPAHP